MTRRQRATSAEGRAEVLSDKTYSASGAQYVSVEMRGRLERGRVPYYQDPSSCTHGISMCPSWDCIESWSVDYKVNLHVTLAGRDLASRLGIDALKFADADRFGIKRLEYDDFKVE
jgi:hypothetical protein